MTIPEDVMEKARKATELDGGYGEPWLVDIIANAILAERQRCAEVARNAKIKVYMHWDEDNPIDQPIVHRNVIAALIEAG